MGRKTGIAWCTATWNPFIGCTKVSAGCENCYMFREQERYGNDPNIVRRSKTTFRDPLHWKESELIFTCSWSDFFHKAADPWRPEAWDIIRATPWHTYQIVTKRPGRIPRHLPPDWGNGWPNVWLITSTENQEQADIRIPQLLSVPAVLHGLSLEPLLGPIDLTPHLWGRRTPCAECPRDADCACGLNTRKANGEPHVGWAIVGGESQEGCRPMDPAWAQDLLDQCRAVGVPFFLKQMGGHPDPRDNAQATLDGDTWTQIPTWGGTPPAQARLI